jgi:DNA repair exonuclease SbcCD ATPase subunit
MNDIETAERTIAQLRDQRDRAAERFTAIGAEREQLRFDAHVNNSKEAKAKLAKLVDEEVALNGTVQSLDGALAEANKRLNAAREAANREAAKKNAKQIRKLLESFASSAHDADDALAAFADAAAAMREALSRAHSLGVSFPTHQQLLSLGKYCLLTALGGTPWSHEFEVISPSQRRSFGDTVATWCENLDRNNLVPLIGELPKQKADAA